MELFLKKFGLALMLTSVLSFAGCNTSDDDPIHEDGCFEYADKTYNSLNAAIRAALDNQEDRDNIIHILGSVTDNEPLSINDGEYDMVTLKLGNYNYVNTKGLDFKSVQLHLSGDGNFECRNSVLSSDSQVELDEDFTGGFSASVTLNEGAMVVNSSKAMVNINQLKFVGRGIFSMEVVSEKPASINIEHLSASDDSKVCAIDDNSVAIKEGGNVHVHHYKLTYDVPSNCCNAGYKTYECEDCGEYYSDLNEGDAGRCIVGNMIHHTAVEPTDTTSGNLEYWECPDCGANYSDAEGTKTIMPIRLPKNYDLPLDILFGCDEAVEKQNFPIPFIFIAQMGFRLLGGLIDSMFDPTDDDVIKKLNELSKQIADLAEQLKDIRKAIDELYKATKNITYGIALNDYSAKIQELSNYTSKYYEAYVEILNNDKLSPAAKKEELGKMLERFQLEMIANRYDGKLLTLLQNYCSTPSMLKVDYKNIPDAQAKYTRNIFLWENMGYTLRSGITLSDFHKLASSYVIINVFLKWTKLSEDQKMMETLKGQLSECLKIWKADVKEMESRNNNYRIYCGGKPGELVYYENRFYGLGMRIQEWFENKNNLRDYYFPRDEKLKETAIRSCEKILHDVDLGDGFFENSHLVATYNRYKDKIGDNKTPNVMKFIGFPAMPDISQYFITERTGEACYNYGHINGQDVHPHYKIFHWWKRRCRRAWFQTSAVINRDDSPVYQLDWWWLRENVDMWASDGKIDDPGRKFHHNYCTIRKVKNVK